MSLFPDSSATGAVDAAPLLKSRMKKLRINITIDRELHKDLKQFAEKNRSTVSAVIDNAVWLLLNPAPTLTRSQVEFSIKKSRKTAQS